MKAIIKKLVKPNGTHFFTLYRVDETGKERYESCNYFNPETTDEEFPSHEKTAYKKIMEAAKLIENDAKEIEFTIYETPDEKQTVGIDLSKIDEP